MVVLTERFPKNAGSILITAKYMGSETEYYLEASTEKTVIPHKSSDEEADYGNILGSYWILILGIIVLIIIVALWLRWRRKHIEVIKQIVGDLVYELETKDKIRKAIYESYLKMLECLRTYGFIRKKSETPDEFEHAVRSALPKVNKSHLQNLTTLFVEARYSNHKLTKKARIKALRNLRKIERSLERSDLEPVVEKRKLFRFQKPTTD
jgi:hypothetical protein